ncbi:glycoside hydrolase family 2 protein [Christiangramia crocea]|uniref:Glycoside hydrolase family 2 protein n=1 Tax=Christiangramia crocea TaxID=2904124 RepID=A0A9X2A4D1_9FLAO|nr:glycoside hydrolase family 2 TIM barrel-domain containing protein [Gramella crocea]MCG9970544.1 glycoside hydrolase family 2 protein [Gramella crocea]
MKLDKYLITSISLFLLLGVKGYGFGSDDELRNKTNINKNWYYLERNLENPEEANNAETWVLLDLPHTWNAEDVVDAYPGYRRSGSWYKKELNFDQISENKLYKLYFEGSNITTEVYVNGQKAGEHIGGYLGFEIDITEFITEGSNEVLVKVDNSYNPEVIPSQKNDFFIYGGITRDVWLLEIPQKHISEFKIMTPEVSVERASLEAVLKFENLRRKSEYLVRGILVDPNGRVVSEKEVEISEKKKILSFDDIMSPKLWDTDNPNLYSLSVLLIENGEILDKMQNPVGFRWFEFKENGPFYLNGERLLLRGTHRHEEHAGVGAAMSNKQHRHDMESIKEMGANFVRLGHYSQDPEIYKACDELGILVWDELPWSRGGLGNENWKTNTRNLLKGMIEQNFNHPSIIIWSLGNEIYWLPDFEDGDNTEKLNEFLSELDEIAHEMDPSRKTAIRKYYEGSHIVDVFSPSIWSGWYSGSYKSYQKAINKYKQEYDHFLHAEYGGSSHVGRHTENPVTGEGIIKSDGWEEEIVQTEVQNIAQIGDWSENYIVDLFDWHLRISETDSTFVGNAQWAFKDFGTPLRPENAIPYMNQKGLVDRNGNPKDAYFVFKSYWSEDPFVYIESHTWEERQGPEGLARTVSIYSNLEEVELFHNGKSLGVKKKDINKFPASGLTWDVQFRKDENYLIARGIDENEKIADTIKVNYRFEKNTTAKAIVLEYEKMNDNYLVTATAIDDNGLRALDYEERVYFQALQGGKTKNNQGTPTGSEIIEMANGKASIEVIPDKNAEYIEMTVLNQSFKGTYLEIPLH